MLSVTGTMRSWTLNGGTRVGDERALWHITAAKLPPAEEPPMATFEGLSCRRESPIVCSQRSASQES